MDEAERQHKEDEERRAEATRIRKERRAAVVQVDRERVEARRIREAREAPPTQPEPEQRRSGDWGGGLPLSQAELIRFWEDQLATLPETMLDDEQEDFLSEGGDTSLGSDSLGFDLVLKIDFVWTCVGTTDSICSVLGGFSWSLLAGPARHPGGALALVPRGLAV